MKIPYFCCIGAELKRYAKDFDFMNQVYLYKVPTDDSIDEVLAEDYFTAISDSVLQDDIVYIYEASSETLHSCRFDKQNGHITAVPLASDETLTGAVTTIIHDNLTKNRAVISNGDGKVAVSDVTTTELGYLSGATSNIQAQLNNKANAYSYASNCITEIPQDIKLELNNGTLTLKAGSKVYVPNGAGVFDAYTLPSDKSVTPSAFSTSSNRFVIITPDKNLATVDVIADYIYSGTTAPTTFDGNGRAYWYDTTNNVIKRTQNSGTTWVGGFSFPIVLVDITSGTGVTKINQVFNGFGYIGSNVFTLPGVKGLIPNRRNNDGTLKNIDINCTSVQISSTFSDSQHLSLSVSSNGRVQRFVTNRLTYIEKDNVVYDSLDDQVRQIALLGEFDTISGKVSNLKVKTTFHAVDYNDTEFIAHQAMPSSTYNTLTLPASGNTVTAPADGYIAISKNTGAENEYVTLRNQTTGLSAVCHTPTASSPCRTFIPVNKGDVCQVVYTTTGNTDYFRFYYANGAK